MLNIRRKTDYALVALARLAREAGAQPLSCRRIATEFRFPLQQMMSVLKDLHRAGLVESTRGPLGGYQLARPASQITLPQVIEAIEGPLKVTLCCEEDEKDACQACRLVPHCPITGRIRQINQQVHAMLERYTLEELLRPEPIAAAGDQPSQRTPSQPLELLTVSGRSPTL